MKYLVNESQPCFSYLKIQSCYNDKQIQYSVYITNYKNTLFLVILHHNLIRTINEYKHLH